ncbi:uncharacterized protein LOC123295562 isoform X2 [Chrysoperla carnea]|uniref:uncharacterized protein LOC123295562 isoform X2 n=1 Tax=Chrysoperla carnea TaxID=189513 RepID=UPI001D08A3A0|nr:uncharacterized protein LOC123295562 isoform X2 [Chrysoperla carnea]
MAELNDPVPLPPGWDCKFDPRTSRYYFINYYTKTTTWEDPRLKNQQLQNHGGHNQRHGSPDLRRNHVYPSNSHASPLRAFQMPANYSPKTIPLQDMSKESPLANRNKVKNEQESSLTADTEQLVTKIGSMFPTVAETHIRLLLKKYYNREAVVMSALQVEKHPITTPGPYSTPPPPIKNFSAMVTRGGSPIQRPGSGGSGSFIGSPRIGDTFKHSPRPHSSPKMKLRYMKSIFPSVEETILLDVLTSNENNVQKASEALLEMGYEKKDMKPPKLQQTKSEEDKANATDTSKEPTPPPRMKTLEEKAKIKAQLQEDYPNIPEQVINLALDSVNYQIIRANQILQIMIQEDNKPQENNNEDEIENNTLVTPTLTKDDKFIRSRTPEPSPEKKPVTDLNKNWRNKNINVPAKTSREESIENDTQEYKSKCIITPHGPNLQLQQGPNNDLLLPDYTTWNGANPNLANGRNLSYAKGPNKLLLQSKTYQAKGPNNDIRKGPIFGLAKGSIYSQLKSILNESRAK